MIRKALFAGAILLALSTPASDADPEIGAEELLARSIAHHDPNGVWAQSKITIHVKTVYSDAYAAKTGAKPSSLVIMLAPGQDMFSYTKKTETDEIVLSVDGGKKTTLVNGSANVSDADRKRLRLADPTLYRNYCEYLYGMPMKLKDPGTIIDPIITRAQFDGRELLKMRVTYEADVGSDTWYFYFDPATHALCGYQFYKNEEKNDGEYIPFSGEIADAGTGLSLPSSRAWYFNNGDGHLATDDIVAIEVAR